LSGAKEKKLKTNKQTNMKQTINKGRNNEKKKRRSVPVLIGTNL
jgi:hypothetical protein